MNVPIVLMSVVFFVLAGFESYKILIQYGRIIEMMPYERDYKATEDLEKEFSSVQVHVPEDDVFPLFFI